MPHDSDISVRVKGLILWLQGELHMGQWELQVAVQDDPPEWAGQADGGTSGLITASDSVYKASIWVSPARSKDPMETAAHEMLHLWLYGAGIDLGDQGPHAERSIAVLEPFLTAKYKQWIGEDDGDTTMDRRN